MGFYFFLWLLCGILILLISKILVVSPRTCVILFNYLTLRYELYQPGVYIAPLFYSTVKNTINERRVYKFPTQTYQDVIKNYSILTDSNLPLKINCSAHILITDHIKAVTSLANVDLMVDYICKAQLRNVFSNLDLTQIITTQANIQQDLLKLINGDLQKYGISCVGFTLIEVELPAQIKKSVTQITSEQMQQKCTLIEAQTKQKVALLEGEIVKQRKLTQLELFKKEWAYNLEVFEKCIKIDPKFSINEYCNNLSREKAYDKSESINLIEGVPSIKLHVGDKVKTENNV